MAKQRRLNKRIVLEAAARLANEGAVEKLTLTRLAHTLDVRVPSLYNHIDGAEGLSQALAVFGAQMLLKDLRAAVAGQSGPPAIQAVLDAYRQFALENPGLYPYLSRAPDPDEAELTQAAQELLQFLLLLLASAGLAGDDALHTVRALRALVHGFVSLEMNAGYKMPLSTDESFHRLTTTYLEGLLGSQ